METQIEKEHEPVETQIYKENEQVETQIDKESDEEPFEEQIDESQNYEYQLNADGALVERAAPLETSRPSDVFVEMRKSITEYSVMINSLIVEIGRPGPRVASECSLCQYISRASIEQLESWIRDAEGFQRFLQSKSFQEKYLKKRIKHLTDIYKGLEGRYFWLMLN